MRRFKNVLVALLFVASLGGLLLYAFSPERIVVDLGTVATGPMQVTVDREGKTRVRERYVVSTPLAGRLRRLELHPGDRVEERQKLLAVVEPGDPALLDPRERAESEARVRAAEEAGKLAETNLTQARADADRARRLAADRSISREDLEHAELRARAAGFQSRIADYELALARAALLCVQSDSPDDRLRDGLPIYSPVSGVVLEVYQESSRAIAAGSELLKVGDTSDLECVIDVLSTDAVKIRPGAPAYLEHWGGDEALAGRVRLVEPAAFLKVSALGVEEQRVNVLIDFVDPHERWRTLGDGYRVEARIVVWQEADVLQAPAGAFFRHGGGWAVFRHDSGRARLTPVSVGRSNGVSTQVLAGLAPGDSVVLHPSDQIRDGAALAPR